MRTSSVDLVILETLGKEHVHLTSHEVYERIRSQLPAVNASTVYRSLERLAKTGKISVSDMGTGSEVYESLADGMHHHLVCQSCGRVITIGHEDVRNFFDIIQKKNDFNISTNHLILFGTCKQCQANEADETLKS
ncbi:MAG TPA: transcriptional repressor [Longilinea sp.]|nr:transcriptional repressor [Longilinea sp.]